MPTATATAQRARAAEKQDYGQSGQLHESRLCSKDQLAALQEAEDEDEQDSAGFLPACKPMSIKTLIVGLRVLETRPEARPLCLSVDSTGLWFDVDTRALDHPGLLPTRPIWWVTKAPGETTGELATEEHAMGLFHVPWLSISRVWVSSFGACSVKQRTEEPLIVCHSLGRQHQSQKKPCSTSHCTALGEQLLESLYSSSPLTPIAQPHLKAARGDLRRGQRISSNSQSARQGWSRDHLRGARSARRRRSQARHQVVGQVLDVARSELQAWLGGFD